MRIETLEEKINRYRARAKAMRDEAAAMKGADAKRRALDIASNYEALAAQLKKRAAKKNS